MTPQWHTRHDKAALHSGWSISMPRMPLQQKAAPDQRLPALQAQPSPPWQGVRPVTQGKLRNTLLSRCTHLGLGHRRPCTPVCERTDPSP